MLPPSRWHETTEIRASRYPHLGAGQDQPSLLKFSSVLMEVRFQFSSWKLLDNWFKSFLTSNQLLSEEINCLLYNLFGKMIFITFPVPDLRRDPTDSKQGSVLEERGMERWTYTCTGQRLKQNYFHGFQDRRTSKWRAVGEGLWCSAPALPGD